MTTTERRIDTAWLALSAVTLASVLVAVLGGRSDYLPNATVSAAVVLIAGAKVIVVGREFMDVRHGPVWLRAAVYGWVVLTIVGVLALYRS